MKIIYVFTISLFFICKVSFSQSITSVNPSNANIGETVIITGNGFDPVPANNTVTFYNGINATSVISSSSTQINVIVPTGAISGTVTVTTNNGTSAGFFFIVNNQQFSLAASFVSSVGSSNNQVYAQPNIVASSNWTINNSAISFRVTGLSTNKDTSRYTNAVNLFKPELANLSLKLALLQRLKSTGGLSRVGIGIETNIYSQTIQSINKSEAVSGSITSFLGKIGIQWTPADGIIFYLSHQIVSNMSGLEDYATKFGKIATSFNNFEFSGMYRVQDGPLKNLYFQPTVIFADSSLQELIGNNDSTVVLIRIGYTAGF